MTKSLRHLILDNIETTLAGITVANGYRTNFVKQQISRSALDFERQMLWPTVLIGVSDAPEELTSGSLPTHDEVNRRLTVDLTLGLNGLTSTLPEDVEYAIADILKAMAADAYMNTAKEAIQMRGGIGFTWEEDTHLWYKRAKSSEVFMGTPAIHRERMMSMMEEAS